MHDRLIVQPKDTHGIPMLDSAMMDRLLEQNDVWAMVGIALAHGATGVFWQTLADAAAAWHRRQ